MTKNAKNQLLEAVGNKFRAWQEQRTHYRFERLARDREQFIETLQKRYGYTKEKAILVLQKHYSKVRHD